MKVAIIGANGQLGSDLLDVLAAEHSVIGLTHADIEITNIDNVKEVLSSTAPELVINAAAYNQVPEAEKFPDKAFAINAGGVLNLARICQDRNVPLVHYSTDYVFDGRRNKPYTEEDCPSPLSVYASSKLAGEFFALNYNDRAAVIRVSGIYGKVPSRSKGANFITTMIKLAREKREVRVVNDEILAPTPTHWIALNTAELIRNGAAGLFHMSCQGECSWYEFAKVIWERLQLETPLYPASVNDFPVVVKRPPYSVLANGHLNKLGIDLMPPWKEGLKEFLNSFSG